MKSHVVVAVIAFGLGVVVGLSLHSLPSKEHPASAVFGGPDNGTPEAAAQALVKAIIAADRGAIDALNKSDAMEWPTNFLLERAYEWKMVGSEIADYEIVNEGSAGVLIANKRIAFKSHWRFVTDHGKYYFTKVID